MFSLSTANWIMQNWVDGKHDVAREKTYRVKLPLKKNRNPSRCVGVCCSLPRSSWWIICILIFLIAKDLRIEWRSFNYSGTWLYTLFHSVCRVGRFLTSPPADILKLHSVLRSFAILKKSIQMIHQLNLGSEQQRRFPYVKDCNTGASQNILGNKL